MKNSEIMVSICCITYNQEDYIRDAIESFLRQKTDFKYEIIIHDDASTDNTANIIKEYEKKYPDIIKPIYQKENQYKKGKKASLISYSYAKGKYIAVCEGDDYWIDDNKLQKQVDYMEKHKKCAFCFHNAQIMDLKYNTKKIFIPYNKNLKKFIKKDNIYNVGELELLEFIPTASFMFRTENLSKMPDWFEKCFVGDWPLKLIMTSFGYAYYINEVMSVYRKNAKGSVTNKNNLKEKQSIEGKKELLHKREQFINWIDEFTKYKYKDVFDYRRAQYKIEELLIEKKGKEILVNKYLNKLGVKERIKVLIKIYFPQIIKFYKKFKSNRRKDG